MIRIKRLYTTPINRYFSIKDKRRTEVWELIGIFLLNLLGRQYDTKNIGLYRDDGLLIFNNCSGSQMKKIKKRLQEVFKNNVLSVIIECNMKIVNYLDVSFNLNEGTYHPTENQIT